MKNEKEIRELINILHETEEPVERLISEGYRTVNSQLLFLKTILGYLETNPSENYIRKSLKSLENIIIAKGLKYEYWKKNVAKRGLKESTYKKLFAQENDLPKIKQQIKTLKFIIN